MHLLQLSFVSTFSQLGDSIVRLLSKSPPEMGIGAIITLLALTFAAYRYSSSKIDSTRDPDKIDRYESARSILMKALILHLFGLFLYSISVTGILNELLNSVLVVIGLIWIVMLAFSIFLLE